MSYIQSRLNSQEIQYQEEEKKRMKNELDYELTRGVITPIEYTEMGLKIVNDYKIILAKILGK